MSIPNMTILESMSDIVFILKFCSNSNTGCDFMYFIGHVNDIDVGQDNTKSPCLSFFFSRNTVFRVNSADLVLPIMSLSLDVWLMSFYNVCFKS